MPWEMTDSFEFPICALILLLVLLIHYFSKRQLPVLRNRIYTASILASSVDACLCLLNITVHRHISDIPKSLGYTTSAIYSVVHILTVLLCTFCVVYALVKHKNRKSSDTILIAGGFAVLASLVMGTQLLLPTRCVSSLAIVVAMVVSSLALQHPETMIDHTTELLNLEAMMAYADELIARKVHYYVIVMRVENIRRINTIFGYSVGSMTLKSVADFLSTFSPDLKERSRMRHNSNTAGADKVAGDARKMERALPSAWAFRLMSNEFAIVSTSMETHEEILNLIHKRFDEAWYIRGLEIALMDTLAEMTETGSFATGEDLIQAIEVVMPTLPKGDMVTLSEKSLNKIERQIQMEKALEQAIATEGLQVRFQPICLATTGKGVRVEALARFHQEPWGEVLPNEFIPIAEKRGLVAQIDEFVLRRACEWLKEADEEGLEVEAVHVNLSVTEMASLAFADRACEILDTYKIRYSRVTFEIEETAMLSGLNLILPNLERLASLGFGFAVDNMSIAQSNFGHLTVLPFTMVKISRHALEAAETSPKDLLLFENIIDVMRKMEIHTVIVGAETEEQSELIVSSSAEMVQGFYYARPMEGDACRAFFKKNSEAKSRRSSAKNVIVISE